MRKKLNNLGAFIVPTGIGATIGGYAGDASFWARRFSKICSLIVNPNVVNAGGFSGITDSMLYVEGYTLNDFFRGKCNLAPSFNNKVGVVFDKSIPKEVLNIHLNTISAVKMVYDLDIIYQITDEPVGVNFFVDETGISTGKVNNLSAALQCAEALLKRGAEAIAIVCRFDEEDSENYANGNGVDPVGGVEAIISHYLSKELRVPVAHAPAFDDYSITSDIISPKASSEYITPTFLPCILIGLAQAPLIVDNSKISIDDLDFLIMPYNSLGSTPVFEAVKRGIKVFAIKENSTVLDVTAEQLNLKGIIEVETYEKCLKIVKNMYS